MVASYPTHHHAQYLIPDSEMDRASTSKTLVPLIFPSAFSKSTANALCFKPIRPSNILAPCLRPRIPRSPPHSPPPLLPPPVLQQPNPPPDPILHPYNPAFPETRARNPLPPSLFLCHNASFQPVQKQRPLLAARRVEHRILDIPLILTRRG